MLVERDNPAEHEIVNGVHDCRGGCGSGLYAHPPKRNAGENCCEESNPNSVSVSQSEANRGEQDRCDTCDGFGNTTAAEKLEVHPEQETSKEQLLQDWAG